MDEWTCFLFNCLLALIILLPLAYSLVFSDKLRKWRERRYAEFVSELHSTWNAALDSDKRRFLAPLAQVVSCDDQLRLKKSIRVMEIGCGTGKNLKYYPDGASLVMVDCAADFDEGQLLDNVKRYPRLFVERIVYSCAEDMCEITDHSVDAVVSTNVLCSVDDERKVLAEIHRVLAPGGKYYMLEPVPDDKWSATFIAQWLLTYSGVWPYIFDGIRLTKDLESAAREAGFETVESNSIELNPKKHFMFCLIKRHIALVATK